LIVTLLLASAYGPLTPWKLVFKFFPGAGAIRAVSRISLLFLIGWAIGLAVMFDQLLRWTRENVGVGRNAAVAAVFALAPISLIEQGENLPTFDKLRNREEIAAIVRKIDPAKCDVFLYSPISGTDEPWKYQLDAMWAQMESGVPTVNGYSGNAPPHWQFGEPSLKSGDDEARLAAASREWIQRHQLNPDRYCWITL
jgi:hypothetical protein